MNCRKPLSLLFAIALAPACNTADTESIGGPEKSSEIYSMPIDPSMPYAYSAQYSSCSGESDGCETEDPPCCGDLFCSNELNVYGPAVCTAPQQYGAFCVEDGQCDSGICRSGACRLAQCLERGESCYDLEPGDTCCAGLICDLDPNTYGIARCMDPLPNGSFCASDETCESNICRGGVCRAGECFEEGEDCYGLQPGEACCEGLLCDFDPNSYGIARCMAPLPVGASCISDEQCASTHCVEGLCSFGECRPEGAFCYDLLGSEEGPPCCEGTFCALDESFYGVASCTALFPEGTMCVSDSSCASGDCEAGVCQ